MTIECPSSVFYANQNIITYLVFIKSGSYNPLELSFLENSALLEYTIARQVSLDLKEKREKK